MSYGRRFKDDLLIYLEDALKVSGDVSWMSYRRWIRDALSKDVLQMSYQKMSFMRCLKDVLYNLSMFYIIYL